MLFNLTLDLNQVAFCVRDVKEIKWNENAFDELVLRKNSKELIRSLVEHRDEVKVPEGSGFDDFMTGKGRGLVINLFGKPGVGKTLTVEATSERMFVSMEALIKRSIV